jgi:hypothetical protein
MAIFSSSFRDHDRDPDLEKGYGREPGHGGPAEIGGGYGHPQAQSQAPVYYGHRPNKRQADDDDERKENPVVTIFKYFLMLLLVLFLLFFVLPTVMTMLSFLFFG